MRNPSRTGFAVATAVFAVAAVAGAIPSAPAAAKAAPMAVPAQPFVGSRASKLTPRLQELGRRAASGTLAATPEAQSAEVFLAPAGRAA